MEIQQIRYFLAMCEELNFSRAAKKCGVAQPSLTKAIRRLEQQFGAALFLRSNRPPRVQLTPIGAHVYPIFVQIDKLLEEAKRAFEKTTQT